MKEYKFIEKINSNNIICNIYYVKSTASYEIVKENLLKIIPSLKDYENINISKYYEIGPKKNFKTSWCTNVINILNKSNIYSIFSIEKHIVYKKLIEFDKMTKCIYNNNTSFKKNNLCLEDIKDITKYNKNHNLGFDKNDISFYEEYFKSIGRNPTNVELYDLSQSNSEHCRHWLFKGSLFMKNGEYYSQEKNSMMNLIQKPYYKYINKNTKHNSLIAFNDNASAIKGYDTIILKNNNGLQTGNELNNDNELKTISNLEYDKMQIKQNITFKAETHNFPTAISPFPAAETGVGGRIRDTVSIGRGGINIAGTAGYCVGNLNIDDYDLNWEDGKYKNGLLVPADKILIEASNGASDYGNKIGEPIIGGFTRSFGIDINSEKRVEWLKPIMFSGGIGFMYDKDIIKANTKSNMRIIKIGGDAFKIGLGGSTASSTENDTNNLDIYEGSVQRGDAEMENKVTRVIRHCINLKNNPIKSIHDQGAGGLSNAVKEIIEPYGANVCLDNIILGDDTMSALEIWCCEYQENVIMLIDSDNDFKTLKNICLKENVSCIEIGQIRDDTMLKVYYKDKLVINYDIKKLERNKNKEFVINHETIIIPKKTISYPSNYSKNNILEESLSKVLSLLSVGSKRFLTNKVDRSVTGLIAQQQCVGYLHTPLSNYSLVSSGYYDLHGIVSSIGEKPINMLLNPVWGARMTIGECLTNLMFVVVSKFEDIKLAGNWMWPANTSTEKYHLNNAVKEVSELLVELGICIDGGKDSVSMSTKINEKIIDSPRTLVISSYCTCPNILHKITPEFKCSNSDLIFIDLGYGSTRLGGSAYNQVNNNIGDLTTNFENPKKFIKVFNIIQHLIKDNKILSGHDRSDGGLITTLCEMSIASNIGCDILLNDNKIINQNNYLEFLFNEELGLVIEVNRNDTLMILSKLENIVPAKVIGNTTENKIVKVQGYNDEMLLSKYIKDIRSKWERTSFELEKKQINNELAEKENKYLINSNITDYDYYYPDKVISKLKKINSAYNTSKNTSKNTENNNLNKFNVGIIRDEGSNGDREMLVAFEMAGFNVYNISMNDLLENNNLLMEISGLAFVGGFSYADALGSANGWFNVIKNNKGIKIAFDNFFNRDDTFSFGVCNGFQLMCKLGILDVDFNLVENDSKRFESRFVNVQVEKSNSIFLKDMEGLNMGIWIAHGEGKLISNNVSNINKNCTIRYLNNEYPLNPNGSIDNITGITSNNGRHFGLMPHPERCFLNWQLPYISNNIKKENVNFRFSPWFLIFKNAYDWCLNF